jgi:hypothetical protein
MAARRKAAESTTPTQSVDSSRRTNDAAELAQARRRVDDVIEGRRREDDVEAGGAERQVLPDADDELEVTAMVPTSGSTPT